MMTTVNTNIKMDPVVKQQAQTLFAELGMNMSTAINIFLKQAIREQAIPFRIGDPFYAPKNIEYLEKVTHDIDAGKAHLAEHPLLED